MEKVMNRWLIFFDDQGGIYYHTLLLSGETPIGLEKFIFEVPEDESIVSMDVSDPQNPKVITEKAKPAISVEKEVEDMQMAIAELYEMLLGAENLEEE